MTLHICRGVNQRFLARVRMVGHRKYLPIGKPTISFRVAATRLAQKMADGSHYKRGDVLFWADYYDPIILLEMKRP